MLVNKFVSAIKKMYPQYGLQDDDIIVASYPKSGNTWVRFIWANMICIAEPIDLTVNFYTINQELSAEYDSNSFGNLTYNVLPRLVKTHKHYADFFSKYRTLYLIRNPEDVMRSYFKYQSGMLNSEVRDHEMSISEFIRSSKYGIKAWCSHVNRWVDKADIIKSYEDLQRNTFGVMKTVLKKFGEENIKDNVIDEAINLSSFENMKKIEKQYGRPKKDKGVFDSEHRFVRKGGIGEGKETMCRQDLDFIFSTVKDNVDRYIYKNHIEKYF